MAEQRPQAGAGAAPNVAPDVVVMGSLHYDILIDADARPRKGETVIGRGWAPKCGGKGGNQALAAARHGAVAAFIGAVGRDGFGAALRANLRAAGVDVAGVREADGGSGLSVAIFDAGGDYGAVVISGANRAVADADTAAVARLRVGGALLMQNEMGEAANLAAAARARAAGARVILNAAPFRPLPAALEAWLDGLVVNEIEAGALGGGPVPRSMAEAAALAARLSTPARWAVVTLGAQGYALGVAGAPAGGGAGLTVRVASTHGAGDEFVGALAARLCAGDALAAAAAYANAAAAALVATPEAERAGLGPADARRLMAG